MQSIACRISFIKTRNLYDNRKEREENSTSPVPVGQQFLSPYFLFLFILSFFLYRSAALLLRARIRRPSFARFVRMTRKTNSIKTKRHRPDRAQRSWFRYSFVNSVFSYISPHFWKFTLQNTLHCKITVELNSLCPAVSLVWRKQAKIILFFRRLQRNASF